MRHVSVQGRKLPIVMAKDSHSEMEIIIVSGWNDVTPFVVWRLNQNGTVVSGDYCTKLEHALDCFYSRK